MNNNVICTKKIETIVQSTKHSFALPWAYISATVNAEDLCSRLVM